MNITVSDAGQDRTPNPFLMVINWIKVGKDWKVASEIILPVPPAPAAKGGDSTGCLRRATKSRIEVRTLEPLFTQDTPASR
jgi:hypothetical protein